MRVLRDARAGLPNLPGLPGVQDMKVAPISDEWEQQAVLFAHSIIDEPGPLVDCPENCPIEVSHIHREAKRGWWVYYG